MDFINELGHLALASRLRRLSDRLMQDVASIYKAQTIEFESRWFPIFYLLSRNSPLSILDIAKMLSITHPAVNQIAADMIDKGLIASLDDKDDKRKRLLELTEKGRLLLPSLERIWEDIKSSINEITSESDVQILDCIQTLEEALNNKSIFTRFQEKSQKRELDSINIEIIDYDPAYKSYFRTLNEEWIVKYFTLEKADEEILNNPVENIIDKKGYVFFAKNRDEIVGTCALIRRGDDVFELTKMAVAEKQRGNHIGKRLAYKAIERAIHEKARAIVLETNSKLTRAIALYTQLGFRKVELDNNENSGSYSRTDTKMLLDLGAN